MATRGFILTFHSHNVAGGDYATNDHVALDATLAHLERRAIPVLRLLDVARRLRGGAFAQLPARFACITFDDGSAYDWRDLEFPGHGVQRSMRSILESHGRHATSFVIASPQARREIGQTALGDADLMTDSWWREAQASGLMDIGTHGWNHVHPAVSEMAARPELVEHFERIDNAADADLQVTRAFGSIRAQAGGDSALLFAYPYGQVSAFIADTYLPDQERIVAALAVEPKPVHAKTNPWRIPRYVCGLDWKSESGFDALLSEA